MTSCDIVQSEVLSRGNLVPSALFGLSELSRPGEQARSFFILWSVTEAFRVGPLEGVSPSFSGSLPPVEDRDKETILSNHTTTRHCGRETRVRKSVPNPEDHH